MTDSTQQAIARWIAAEEGQFFERKSVLEREIDGLVYALYGLTEEEIKIVEGKA